MNMDLVDAIKPGHLGEIRKAKNGRESLKSKYINSEHSETNTEATLKKKQSRLMARAEKKRAEELEERRKMKEEQFLCNEICPFTGRLCIHKFLTVKGLTMHEEKGKHTF
jgi:hypothetical protein